MRKIYSLVLMTAMLFVGANAWAVTQVATTQQLETAWANAQSGDTIQLTDNVDMDKTLWLGTNDMNGTPRSLTLDLNGHKLINDGTRQKLFFISHGELNVITSVAGGEIQHGTISADNYSSSYVMFLLAGSTYKTLNPKTATSGYYTHLTIGNGVTLTAKAVAVAIDAIGVMTWPISSTTTVGATGVTISGTMPPSLNTKIYPTKNRGVANGVRVDVHGYIRASKYAFKANGLLGAPSDRNVEKDPSPLTGFVVDPANLGLDYTIANTDTAYTPFIRLYSTADMWVQADNNSEPKNSDKPVAVYCSGYSRWLIEGTCVGSTGVYVKSGDVDIHDATIQSTYTGTYTPPTGTGSGTQGQGSAIVIESSTAYAGDIDVNIGGDTKVTATNGYAIDEKVTTSDTTKVDAIVITGGSFEGGVVGGTPENPTYGTIAISETTAEAKDGQATGKTETTTIVVSGGSVEGNVSYGNEGDINNIVDDTQSYMTIVTDPETGKQTVVISQGEEPTAVASDFNVDTVAHKIDVKMDDAVTTKNQVITGTNKTVTLGTLTMNPATTPVTLTVKSTNTLIVDKIIMGYKAQIIVEQGAKLIVMGEQGITAPAVNNIVLKATETSQATFLFNPAVSSNRQPKATVELYTTAYEIDAQNGTWQRFTSPMAIVDSLRNSFLAEGGQLAPTSPYATLRTWINYWDYSELKWKQILSTNMTSFTGYKLTNNSKNGGVKYRLYGNLQGSVTSDLAFKANGFNYFGNSYTAPMHIKTLLDQLEGTSIDKNVNLWNTTYQRFDAVTANDINEGMAEKSAIPAMETFIFRLVSGGASAHADVNYTQSVWGYNTSADPESYNMTAPARVENMNRVRIYIESANGDRDYVTLRQAERFSAEYESGADAVKLMQDGVMNFYVNGEEENLSSVAADNMLGMFLSLKAADEIQYTLSFANVCGEPMYLKDMINGQVIEMTEGNTYNFVAQANEENVGRFQIVSRQEMPTAVETIEETVAPKAIYTIMGQYVGETTDWNNLPAGVYVVDGVKVIK